MRFYGTNKEKSFQLTNHNRGKRETMEAIWIDYGVNIGNRLIYATFYLIN